MIASWRGVAVAGVLALVLAAAVAIDLGRARGAVDHSLVPGFDAERVTELVWDRPGQPAVRVVRAGDAWQIRAPSTSGGSADPTAISDVLAALRGARWHRRGEPVRAHATLTVVSGSERRAIGLGEPIAGTDQLWITDGDRGVVVDQWVARALDRDVLALRIRSPLADVDRAQTIVIELAPPAGSAPAGALRLEGAPRRLVRPVAVLLAPELSDELERALAALAIVRLPSEPTGAHGIAISIAGSDASDARGTTTVEIGGRCPGAPELVAVAGTAGDGCLEPAAATAIERAVTRLRQSPDALVDRRPIPFEPRRIVLGDGAELAMSPPRVAGHPADPARIAELLAALAAPAEVAALPAKPAIQHLVVGDRAGASIALDLYAERVVARRGEPVALRPAPGAWQLLVRSSRELRDPALWLEEPTTITALRIDAVSYQRGAVIGEWTRQPPGALDAKLLEALVATLAAPRALGVTDEGFAPAHRIMITITPPSGPATERSIDLGASRAAGCPARIDGETVLLASQICAYSAALAH